MIPFTQYMRPNGRKVRVEVDRPAEIERRADALIKLGAVFEIEELMSGMVSMTCERDTGDDDEVLGHELCSNGPEVPGAVDTLVNRAYIKAGL